MGADYIEPDLVSTKDGVLVARHENDITGTTDVADHPEFAGRRTTKVIDGIERDRLVHRGLHARRAEDAARQGAAARPAPGQHRVRRAVRRSRRFQEVIDLARREGVGIYPETKHPTYFDSHRPVARGAAAAHAAAQRPGPPRARRSSSSPSRRATCASSTRRTKLPLVQLIDSEGAPADLVAAGDPRTYDDLVTPAGLDEIATYADGIGPAKTRIVPWDEDDRLGAPTSLVRDAHARGLLVHPFTFRPENSFLPADFRQGDPDSPRYDAARGDQPAELRAVLPARRRRPVRRQPGHRRRRARDARRLIRGRRRAARHRGARRAPR